MSIDPGPRAVPSELSAPELAAIQMEMGYTDFEDSCRDPALDDRGQLRQCRRFRGHKHRGDPRHASGFPLYVW